MANQEHLLILKKGVKAWNEWREGSPDIKPILSSTTFHEADFEEVNFSDVKLNYCHLIHANLNKANLNGARLVHTNLSRSNLKGASLIKAKLTNAILMQTQLTGADMTRAILQSANLKNAVLQQVKLDQADLSSTNLQGAQLQGASLIKASLSLTNFARALLDESNLSQSTIYGAIFTHNDLSTVVGLDTVKHQGPSSIGIETIYKSSGNIPEVFLRGCGVPDDFITYMRSLTTQSIQFYSCFISYSSKDHPFAERLYADLQNNGVRSWFAPEDLKIGAEIRTGIDESIRVHDKLLLVLSETSVKSQWVQQEVETALAKEREQDRTVLFPIRLDDAVMQINTGWPAYLKNTRNIGDFREWKNHDSYQKAFDRLLRDLKAGDGRVAEG